MTSATDRLDEIPAAMERFCDGCSEATAAVMLEIARDLESTDWPQDGLVAAARRRLEQRLRMGPR